MARVSERPQCSDEVLQTLRDWAIDGNQKLRRAEKAKIILKSMEGKTDLAIAHELGVMPNTVSKWRHRFIKDGLEGLNDLPRAGYPLYDHEKIRESILDLLDTPPPKGKSAWDGVALAKALGVPDDVARRVLREEQILPQKHWNFNVNVSEDFSVKRVDIVGLYLNPPVNAMVVCVEENKSPQGEGRPQGYVLTTHKKLVMGLRDYLDDHGALNLAGALKVATEQIKEKITSVKRKMGAGEFLGQIGLDHSPNREYHVIMDNRASHKKITLWDTRPVYVFHHAPSLAAWLSSIGIWFSVLTSNSIRGDGFLNPGELTKAISDFIEVYDKDAEPFIWRKPVEKGGRLPEILFPLPPQALEP
ncbi:MAG: IS630 family transposase [Deltaproteobacteria bacterium]|nr:IS630 family transposase [Deltaproteobacteria bacterium]